MSRPYDPTLKALIETAPDDWPVLAGQPRAATTVIDADIATVSGAADKVLRVADEPPYLLHLEFQVGHDSGQLQLRNVLLEVRHHLRVRSVVVLLRPEADARALSGIRETAFPGKEPYALFRYQIVRVWKLPVQALLSGGLGTLPLAPISAVTEADLPGIIGEMQQRLGRRPARSQAASLWAATYILMGIRYSRVLAAQLLQGVVSMKESVTYQAILEEGEALGEAKGRIAEAKRLLQMQGQISFGPPDAQVTKVLEGINDLQRLEELGVRLLKVSSWQELLGLSRKRGRRPPAT